MSAAPKNRDAITQEIFQYQCKFLEQKHPQLLALGMPVMPHNAAEIFDIYCWHVRRSDQRAATLDLVDHYERLLTEGHSQTVRLAAQAFLFHIQASRGLVHKAGPFIKDNPELTARANELQSEHALHYGYDLRTFDMRSVNRGITLTAYFAAHQAELRGKSVLHIAPEAELRRWMSGAAKEIGFDYTTADGFMPDVDFSVDLCSLAFSSESFDLIIMHRVLEHVIDDFTALAELHRVLRPGGTLNISVPEALYLQKTMDWLVPDPRVHHHYRMYGRDFQALLLKAGFDAERSEYLLKLQPDQLKSLGAYPMLIYVARKA